MNKQAFEKRAQQLRDLAQKRGVEGLGRLDSLPEGDPVAQIGFLASRLDLDFGLAFDTDVAFEERA